MTTKRKYARVPFLDIRDFLGWIESGGNCYQGCMNLWPGVIDRWRFIDNRFLRNMSFMAVCCMYRHGVLMAAADHHHTIYGADSLGLEETK